MRYAIVSDLHANLAAWQQILADLTDLKADSIICLGDVVGYGPQPVEVLESVYRVVNVTLMGNHDAAVCGRLSTENFTPRAAAAVARHRELLSREALGWMAQLPLIHEGNGFRCAHGDFSAPDTFRYVTSPESAMPSWQATEEQLLFVGHSHLPGIYVIGQSGVPHYVAPCDFELEAGKRYIINPGSVGYPRVGDIRSSYCIYDDVARAITFRQLPFDRSGFREAMHGMGIDDEPWTHDEEQQLPVLREAPRFRRPGKKQQSEQDDGAGAVQFARSVGGAMRFAKRFWPWTLATIVLLMALAVSYLGRGGASAGAELSVSIPPFELSSIAAYPLVPPNKNLLPPLPPAINPDGRLEGWRYSFESRATQSFRSGLRSGATTLCIENQKQARVVLQSPIINLAGTGATGIRLQGRIRKHDSFKGTVFYQLVSYRSNSAGQLERHLVRSEEMRSSRRKLTPPAAERDFVVPLSRQITHVRLRIEGDFSGLLEVEQPALRADLRRKNK